MQNTRTRPFTYASPLRAFLVAPFALLLAAVCTLDPSGSVEGLAHGNLGPYHWVSPPAQFLSGNQPPLAGHLAVRAMGGATTAGGAATDDGQAQLGFDRGGFVGSADVTVDIAPMAQFPAPKGFEPATNVYLIRATAPLAKPATVTLGFSPDIPPPTVVYATDVGGTGWRPLSSTPFQQAGVGQVITAQLDHLPAYVAAASAGASPATGPPPAQAVLPWLAGILLLAAIPSLLLGKVVLFGSPGTRKRSNKRRRPASR